MAIGAFPVAKLGTLVIKQISKPIANVIKNQAKSSPVFRRYVCMPPAQFYNWCEVTAKMWILNLGRPVNIPVLNEAMAIELGANLLGEGVLFLIAAGILISEYNRSARKEAAKEEAKLKEMSQLHNTIQELFIQSEEQGAHIRELTRKIGDLETRLMQSNLKQAIKPSPPVRSGPSPSTPVSPKDKNLVTSDDLVWLKNTDNIVPHSTDPYLSKNVLLKAVNDIGFELWNYPSKRENGILIQGLEHLYGNVFKMNFRN